VNIVRASWIGTAVFAVTAVAAALVKGLGILALVVALAMFGAGVVAFVAAFVRAADRSRFESIGVTQLFLFEGTTAPKRIRRLLFGSLTVEIAIAFATAAARPNTSLAFGILAPMYGLGLTGLWGARHGTFEARDKVARRPGEGRWPTKPPSE
jgi:hypothetical protein